MKTNWRRLLIAFVAVYVLMQVSNFVVHGLWLASTYASLADIWRPDAQSKVWMHLGDRRLLGLLLRYIFVRGYEGEGTGRGRTLRGHHWPLLCDEPGLQHLRNVPDPI